MVILRSSDQEENEGELEEQTEQDNNEIQDNTVDETKPNEVTSEGQPDDTLNGKLLYWLTKLVIN